MSIANTAAAAIATGTDLLSMFAPLFAGAFVELVAGPAVVPGSAAALAVVTAAGSAAFVVAASPSAAAVVVSDFATAIITDSTNKPSSFIFCNKKTIDFFLNENYHDMAKKYKEWTVN
jgi:hypothetical protein